MRLGIVVVVLALLAQAAPHGLAHAGAMEAGEVEGAGFVAVAFSLPMGASISVMIRGEEIAFPLVTSSAAFAAGQVSGRPLAGGTSFYQTVETSQTQLVVGDPLPTIVVADERDRAMDAYWTQAVWTFANDGQGSLERTVLMYLAAEDIARTKWSISSSRGAVVHGVEAGGGVVYRTLADATGAAKAALDLEAEPRPGASARLLVEAFEEVEERFYGSVWSVCGKTACAPDPGWGRCAAPIASCNVPPFAVESGGVESDGVRRPAPRDRIDASYHGDEGPRVGFWVERDVDARVAPGNGCVDAECIVRAWEDEIIFTGVDIELPGIG